MKKLILLGANWCPITKQTRQLFKDFNLDYQYIDIDSKKGKELVNKFSVTDVPKTIYQDKIIFHGLPNKGRMLKLKIN